MAKAKAKRPRRIPGGNRSLRRTVEIRTPKRTFLVFCEGARTEPEYIEALKREPAIRDSASVDLRIEASGAVPLTLVNAAAEARASLPGARRDGRGVVSLRRRMA